MNTSQIIEQEGGDATSPPLLPGRRTKATKFTFRDSEGRYPIGPNGRVQWERHWATIRVLAGIAKAAEIVELDDAGNVLATIALPKSGERRERSDRSDPGNTEASHAR